MEIAGALKNIIAIAAGLSDAMNFGFNSRAALMTRGLAEIARLGTKLGARRETFSGLAGMGDLVLTCTGPLSRNRHVGLELGRGRRLADIVGRCGRRPRESRRRFPPGNWPDAKTSTFRSPNRSTRSCTAGKIPGAP